MELGRIVLKLRAENTTFGSAIGGAAEFAQALNYTLKREMAFVIPSNEDATDNSSDNTVDQIITERYSVILALQNDSESSRKLGLAAYDRLHSIRNEILNVLVGWDMGYEGVTYFKGGRVVGLDAAYLWYQYDFEFTARLKTDVDGFGEIQTTIVDERQQRSQLPDFNDIYTQYIMKPSVKWEEVLKDLRFDGTDLPITETPDMETFVDLSQPYTGSFSFGFLSAFDYYRENK